ncbi:O-antigen polymerase [Bacillus sp. Cs-700]|uniref:O-antigen polymerase n=1 Tax=Bacillus sp. Cs-700 TaxID=2589818 RepID=UPI00140B88BB|nr:O-antigen polymerase [Bacillus sp. Cs-700]
MIDILGIIVLGYVIVAGFLLNHIIEKTWVSPIFLVNIWVAIFILGDAVYTFSTKEFGPGEFERFSTDFNEVGTVSLVWSVALTSFYIAYFLLRNKRKKIREISKENMRYNVNFRITKFLFVITLIISMLALLYMVSNALSMGYSLVEVTQLRNKWFSDGGGILLTLIQSFKFALLVYIFSAIVNKKVKRKNIAFLIVLTLLIDLFLGTRSNFIYGFLLPLLIVIHQFYKQISIKKLAVLGIVIFLFIGVFYRTIARDQYFQSNENQSISNIVIENFSSMPHFFWGGFEASSFDGAIDVLRKYPNQSEFLYGESLIKGLSAPIPRSLWDNKPRGGGNAIYTQTFYPEFYGEIRSEYSVSFIGELYMNGGIIFVVVGFSIMGAILGAIYKILFLNGRNVFYILLYSLIISRTYSLFRGDFYNFFGQLFIGLLNLFLVFLFYKIISEIILNKEGSLDSRQINSGRGFKY